MGAIPWAPQFQNGDTAAIALMVDWDGEGHYLQPAAARSLRALAAAFYEKFAVKLTTSEAFRDLPTQRRLYDLYRSGKGNVAAVPGTSSHGQGLAVDINSWVYGNSGDTERHRWLVENAPRFGWSWELVGKPSGEDWHFNYVGAFNAWAATSTTSTEEDDDMKARFWVLTGEAHFGGKDFDKGDKFILTGSGLARLWSSDVEKRMQDIYADSFKGYYEDIDGISLGVLFNVTTEPTGSF